MISTRAASQASMIPRLVCRSTIAPAGRAMSANAAVAADVSRPTSKVLALSRTTAVSGSASWVTDEPISLTVWPPHSSMKSRCRHRLSRFPASPGGASAFAFAAAWCASAACSAACSMAAPGDSGSCTGSSSGSSRGSGTAYTLVGGLPAMSIYIPSLSASWRALTWA